MLTEDISCVYRGNILCLQRTYPVFTEDKRIFLILDDVGPTMLISLLVF